ncbi:MAG: prephenate dehydrogenase/arogenate dehydrogenase family protein [bacterium]
MLFPQMTIVGVGLIGGSLAKACKQKGLVKKIIGINKEEKNVQKAKELGIIDDYKLDIKEGVRESDIVVLAVPVSIINNLIEQIIPHLKNNCIVTDVGSTKRKIVALADRIIPRDLSFVGGHPIAGTENSGVEASLIDLFLDKKCILTPTPKTNLDALEKVKKLWTAVGSEVVLMDAAIHDRIFATVSHLPHIIAFCLVNSLGEMKKDLPDILRYPGGGFKDFTRIASSDPKMWTDICLSNKEDILKSLDFFITRLNELRDFIKEEKLTDLMESFKTSQEIRKKIKP